MPWEYFHSSYFILTFGEAFTSQLLKPFYNKLSCCWTHFVREMFSQSILQLDLCLWEPGDVGWWCLPTCWSGKTLFLLGRIIVTYRKMSLSCPCVVHDSSYLVILSSYIIVVNSDYRMAGPTVSFTNLSTLVLDDSHGRFSKVAPAECVPKLGPIDRV